MMEQSKKKKKITLNHIGLIILVLMAAAYFYLWQARSGTETQIAVMSNDITLAQMQIDAMQDPAEDLPAQLETVKAELSAAQAGFPNTLDRNEVVDYLLDVAGYFSIDILPLESYGWALENIGREYKVLKISIIARGSLKDVENFMDGLHSGRYPTLVISGCEVSRTDILTPGFPGDDMKVTVNMDIGIYTVAPDSGEGAL